MCIHFSPMIDRTADRMGSVVLLYNTQIDFSRSTQCSDFPKVPCGSRLCQQTFDLELTPFLPSPLYHLPIVIECRLQKVSLFWRRSNLFSPSHSHTNTKVKILIDPESWCSFQIPVRIHPPHWFHHLLWLGTWGEHTSVPMPDQEDLPQRTAE